MGKDSQLDASVIKWATDSLPGPGKYISSIQLKGSTSSTLHAITFASAGKLKEVVVRQFDNKEWLKEEPEIAYHEAESLHAAAEAELNTPELIAKSVNEKDGMPPLVLMSKLPGSVVLKPANMDDWLGKLAMALVGIHQVEAPAFSFRYYSYNDPKMMEVPAWSKNPSVWRKLAGIVKQPEPGYMPRFIHRDYHPVNVLWENGIISGVVDWVNACKGPAGVDVGHCRWNLAMLYGVKAADLFLHHYTRQAGEKFTYDVYWDIVSLNDVQSGRPQIYPGWTAFGFTGLTDALMAQRTDEYAASLEKRIQPHHRQEK